MKPGADCDLHEAFSRVWSDSDWASAKDKKSQSSLKIEVDGCPLYSEPRKQKARAHHSGEICILKQLKDGMADKTDAQEAEEDRKTDHAAQTAAKEEDVALVKATIEANSTRQGLLAVEVVCTNGNLTEAETTLLGDKESAANLRKVTATRRRCGRDVSREEPRNSSTSTIQSSC